MTAVPVREKLVLHEAVGTTQGGQRRAGGGAGALAGNVHTLWLLSLLPFPLVTFCDLKVTDHFLMCVLDGITPTLLHQVLQPQMKGNVHFAHLLGLV